MHILKNHFLSLLLLSSALFSFSPLSQATYDEEAILRSRQSVVKPETELRHGESLDFVRKKIAANIDEGPFMATSGIEVPYYLSLITNSMDDEAAPAIVDLMTKEIEKGIKDFVWKEGDEEPVLIVGPETVGQILVSQLVAQKDSPLKKWAKFAVLRKKPKETGTRRQLEGPKIFTSRTPEKNPKPLKAIWVDDALSTGSSLLEGWETLKKKHNIEIAAAIYFVDRAQDRQTLADEKCKLADPRLQGVHISALMDLKSVDDEIQKFLANKKMEDQE